MPITQPVGRLDFKGPQVHIAVARACFDKVHSIHLMSFLSTAFNCAQPHKFTQYCFLLIT